MLKQLKEKLAILESKVAQYEEDSEGLSEIDFRCQLEEEIGILEEEFVDLQESGFSEDYDPQFINIKKRINKIKDEYNIVTSIDIDEELNIMFPNQGDDDE